MGDSGAGEATAGRGTKGVLCAAAACRTLAVPFGNQSMLARRQLNEDDTAVDTRFMLVAAILSGVISLGISSMMFSNRDKGFTASQWLMMVFIFVVLMMFAYIYQLVF